MITRSIQALSIAPAIYDWLTITRYPRVLHVFDQACNLVNEQRKVLSIVTPTIGNGPFNIVVGEWILFSEHLQAESPVFILASQLHVGDLIIKTTYGTCWSPCPSWEKLHNQLENINRRITTLHVPPSQIPYTLRSGLVSALAKGDIALSKSIASQIAGVGMGLTPAGDDFLLGALYAIWIIHPLETAKQIANEVGNIAAPLTTSLSAAWLRSAGRGEAGISWHDFFSALVHHNPKQIRFTMDEILATGATSGSEALAGFISTFHSYVEMKNYRILPY